MNCPKCGAVLGADAKFCMSCGVGLDASMAASGKRAGYFPYVVGAVLLLVGLFALNAAGVLRLGGRGGPESLQVGAGTSSPSTTLPFSAPPQSLAVSSKAAEPSVAVSDQRMPDDVRRWLEHLKRVDQMRESYNSSLVGEMMRTMLSVKPGTLTDEDDVSAANDKRKKTADDSIKSVDGIFNDLTKEFQRLPPPAECGPIAERYAAILLGTRLMLTEIVTAMQAGDIKALESKKGTSFSRIDTEAEGTNGLIDAICKKYKEPNKYVVFVDKPGSLGLGMGADMTPDTADLAKIVDKLLKDSEGN